MFKGHLTITGLSSADQILILTLKVVLVEKNHADLSVNIIFNVPL